MLRLDLRALNAPRLAALRAHPAFPQAMGQWATDLVGRYDGNRLLNRLLNDRERAMFALMALYLHVTPDESGAGLTAGRIIALCTETQLCSRGRAKAMLVLMRWAGYIEPSPAGRADRRQRPLVPTAAFFSSQVERWRSIYEAVALLDPIGATALEHLEDPAFRVHVVRGIISRFRAGERLLDHAPALALFAARDCGLMVLLALALSRPPEDAFPPQGVLTVPVAALGRRFHVSRAHVLKLLRDAETAGLLERPDRASGGLRLEPPLRQGLADFFAAVFVLFADAARDACATIAATPRP